MGRKKSNISTNSPSEAALKAEAARRASVQRKVSKKKKKVSHDKWETVILLVVSLGIFLGVGYLVYSSPTKPVSSKMMDPEAEKSRRRDSDTPLVVGGYLPNYRKSVELDDSAEFLTDVMLFSLELTEDGLDVSEDGEAKGCCIDNDMVELGMDTKMEASLLAEKNNTLRGDNKQFNILMTVGGGGRSNGFPSLTNDRDKRQKLIEDLRAICIRENLDGVDFDWEQPRSQEEVVNYALLVVGTANVFHASGLLVTIALHAQQPFPGQVFQFVDRVHLMTYDMLTALSEGETTYGYHASYDKTVAAVEDLIKSGCPPYKIALGIPAYARSKKSPMNVMTYSEIVDEIMAGEEEEAVPSLDGFWNVDSHKDFHFDSPKMISKKVKYAEDRGLAGVFFWELGQDKQLDGEGGFLVEAAARAAAGKDKDTFSTDNGENEKDPVPFDDEKGKEAPDKSEL